MQKPTARGIEQTWYKNSSTLLLGYKSDNVRGNKINRISITNRKREDYYTLLSLLGILRFFRTIIFKFIRITDKKRYCRVFAP